MKDRENNKKVSVLFDNRHLAPKKTYMITAITVMGKATALKNCPKSILSAYIEKHSELTDFAKAENSKMIEVSVSKYIVVSRFQKVIELTM